MAKIVMTLAAAGAMALASSGASWAGPISAAPLLDLQRSASPIEHTRVYCYNRYTGRFLHWGSCGGGGYYHRTPGRVYCRTRYGHHFLHWGAC